MPDVLIVIIEFLPIKICIYILHTITPTYVHIKLHNLYVENSKWTAKILTFIPKDYGLII